MNELILLFRRNVVYFFFYFVIWVPKKFWQSCRGKAKVFAIIVVLLTQAAVLYLVAVLYALPFVLAVGAVQFLIEKTIMGFKHFKSQGWKVSHVKHGHSFMMAKGIIAVATKNKLLTVIALIVAVGVLIEAYVFKGWLAVLAVGLLFPALVLAELLIRLWLKKPHKVSTAASASKTSALPKTSQNQPGEAQANNVWTLPPPKNLWINQFIIGKKKNWLGKEQPLFAPAESLSALVIGASRSGKTLSMISQLKHWNGTFITTSTKMDVFQAVAGERSKALPKAVQYLVDFSNPQEAGQLAYHLNEFGDKIHQCYSMMFSPLAGCADYDTAVRKANILMANTKTATANDDYWTTNGEHLLAPLLHAAELYRKEEEIKNTYALEKGAITIAIKPTSKLLHWLKSDAFDEPEEILKRHNATMALQSLRAQIGTEARHRSDVRSSVTAKLNFLSQQKLLDAVDSAKPFNWIDFFLSGGDALYIVSPTHTNFASEGLVMCAVSDALVAIDEIGRHFNGKLPIPTLLALDELANICPLPKLPQIVSEVQGKNVHLWLAIQDWAQLKALYGEQAQTIFTNCHTHFVFPGIRNTELLQTLEKLSPVVWVKTPNLSGADKDGNQQAQQIQEPQFKADKIHAIPAGTVLIYDTRLGVRHFTAPWFL